MKQVTVKFAGVEATGPTLTAAKKLAEQRAAHELEQDYYPTVLTFFGLVGFMWSMPLNGWHYTVVHPNDDIKRQRDWSECGCCNAVDCEKSMRNHMAQLAMDILPISKWDETLDIITNINDKETHRWYLNWQRCARAWGDLGADMETRRAYADKNQWPTAQEIATILTYNHRH